MAQQLKEEVRNRIIEAAKQEFKEFGYDNASMRHIAQNSKMTVGNMYRYFESKEALLLNIVSPTLNKIDELLKSLTKDSVTFDSNSFSFPANLKEIRKILDVLGDRLVDIYIDNKEEFNILMMHSSVNDRLVDWFTNLIDYFILQKYHFKIYEKEIMVMSRVFAVSIFDGMKELFRVNDVKASMLKSLVKIYFRAYINMIDVDIKKYIG